MIAVNLVHDQTNILVVGSGIEVEVPRAGSDLELILPVAGATFQATGGYSLTVSLGGQQIGSWILEVRDRTDQEGSE